MTHEELIADLRSRINPAYAAQRGTESYERRLCVEALEAQHDEICQLGEMLKTAYCQRIGADDPTGLDCCDDYLDWLKTLQTPNVEVRG